MRKPEFCMECENLGANQLLNRTADQRLCSFSFYMDFVHWEMNLISNPIKRLEIKKFFFDSV